jgi:glycosyltransferase involved in cell wall biosynthesis
MKILMVLDEEFPPDVRVEKEAFSLRDQGHKLDILCYSLTKKADHEEYFGIEIYRKFISRLTYKFKALSLSFPFYFNFWRKALKQQIENHDYDALHFHDLTLAKVCIEAGQKNNLPVIGDYHENRPEIMKLYHHVKSFPGNILISLTKWDDYQRQYSKKLKHLVLVTEQAKTYYHHHYGIANESMTVVQNYPNIEKLYQIEISNAIVEKYSEKFMLIYFGDTGIRRGTETILEVAEALKNQPKFHFVIIGTSREQSKLEKIKQNKNLDNVELLGYVPTKKAISYIVASKAGLCPFHRNIHHDTTFANKLFQYMAFGKPVIVSDCVAQAQIIEESRSGLIFEAKNPVQLKDAIVKLSKADLYTQLSKNAEKAVVRDYDYSIAEKNLIYLYRKIEDDIKRT